MMHFSKKTGNGAFEVHCVSPSRVCVTIERDSPKVFASVKQAYDWCVAGYTDLQGTMRGFSYLNAAFELEDVMENAA